MIRRAALIARLYGLLENEYVALLGQTGSGLESVLSDLQGNGRDRDFGFISLMIPRTVRKSDEFTDLVVERVIAGAGHLPRAKPLTKALTAAMRANRARSADYRLGTLLDALGLQAPTRRLVVIMHTLPDVDQELLRPLLLTLCDYHGFRSEPGHAGERLRFLVAGGAALWRLCYHKQQSISPFSIAKRVFVTPFDERELKVAFPGRDAEWLQNLRVVTAGVSSLVRTAGDAPDLADLRRFFAEIQAPWNALPDDTRRVLLRSVSAAEIRDTIPDFECPAIPQLRSPWLEAFWQGFLRVEGRKLVWSCEAHRQFVELQQPARRRRGESPARGTGRNLVFVSYSRRDGTFAKALRIQLGAMEHDGLLSTWIDVEQLPGTIWRPKLEAAIQEARVAVLLVSDHYLDSEFVRNDELPAIMQRRGLMVIPVIVRSCMFDEIKSLAQFGAFNSPGAPLDKMRTPKRTEVLRDLARKIMTLLGSRHRGTDQHLRGLPKRPTAAFRTRRSHGRSSEPTTPADRSNR